jgi:hypothetical protein
MKIVLVDKETGLFLSNTGSYTERFEDAKNFAERDDAVVFCREQGLRAHKILALSRTRSFGHYLGDCGEAA